MDSKRLNVIITVSVQLQRAVKDTRRWIRVLSSETIGHLKKLKVYALLTQMLALLGSTMLASRNYFEKVTLDVGSISSSPSSKSSDVDVLSCKLVEL